MRTRTISGEYGSNNTPCDIFVYGRWYVIEGSTGVNCAPSREDLYDGVNVEEIRDIDFFTADKPIESEEELEEAVDC